MKEGRDVFVLREYHGISRARPCAVLKPPSRLTSTSAINPRKALGTDSKMKQGPDDFGDDMYTKSAPQTTDSSTTSRILNVEEGVAPFRGAETNVEDRTAMFLSNLLSDAENAAAYERGKITARNTQQVEMRIGQERRTSGRRSRRILGSGSNIWTIMNASHQGSMSRRLFGSGKRESERLCQPGEWEFCVNRRWVTSAV
jgi:hypothetical protein